MSKLKVDWDLEKYFYSSIKDELFLKDIETYKSKSDIFIEKYKGKISELDDLGFLSFLEELETLSIEIERVLIFLGFLSSLDTQNQEIQKEAARIDKMMADYSEKFIFIGEEYKLIGWRRFEAMSKMDLFNSFKNYLRNEGISIQYILSEPEEKVVIKLSTAYDNNLYEELVTSFEYKFKDKKISEDEVRILREDQDRETRKEAFKVLSQMYLQKQNQVVLGNLYSTVCKDNVATIELRKFETVISQRNISEELSDKTVETLLKNVSDNYSLYHSFLSKKAEILSLEKLETFDVFAPYPGEEDSGEITFEEGWKLYIDAIENVDPLLASFSEEMLREGRISVYPREGKASGAYAQYTKNLPEFVLLNWTNTSAAITTLAHELGHAFHGNLSKKQKNLVYSTPLTLAETASIFNETLMFEILLEKEQDKIIRNKLIFNRLDDIFSTIFRQVSYVLFEKRCHESFQKNEPLTYDDFNLMWAEETSKFFGQNINLDKDLIKHGWSSIPHIFHTPFYCYTYAFGNIISLNLYQTYKKSENKNEFIEKYHQLLSAGGSDTPENLLNSIFGIKFDENFYKLAFENIEELLQKLD